MSAEEEFPPGLPDDVVKLTASRLLCPVHGEHLRAHWPIGFMLMGVKLFQAATENHELWVACGYVKGEKEPGVEQINAVTDHKPLCYFVDDDTLRRLFRDTRILKVLRCDKCGLPGDAGPYTVVEGDGLPRTVTLCLECMLAAGRRLHAEYPDGDAWRAAARAPS